MSRYEITVLGVVGPVVLSALDGFDALPCEPGRSCLSGEVVDQAALHGLLDRLLDLRIEIIDVHRVVS